uniref:Uncharacterized protein n=1 Tax=Anguilla anguilla TaxID=7936 RepID=A0A0E9R8U1_ANGAN
MIATVYYVCAGFISRHYTGSQKRDWKPHASTPLANYRRKRSNRAVYRRVKRNK